MENPSSLPFLLVTANVGSVFEDPSRLLNIWIQEFLSHVVSRRPAFIALHLQEVGGKTYEKSMEYVQEFIKNLCESAELADYNRIRVYLDEDYNSAEHFTALGNLYFAIRTIGQLEIWNFLTHEWDTVGGKNIHTGNIESVATKEKAKFPQQFFPECKWSRKGFLRTRWSVNGTVFDLVNIHLFHDASNLAACEEYPSVYCKSRRRALVHTLERFHKDKLNKAVPYFVFGDFNFRCDTEGVIKKLTEDLTKHQIPHAKIDNSKVQYRDSEGANVLTVGKKEFNHNDQSTFKESWLRQFDRELDSLRSILYEYPITFPPSYPYEEDPLQPGSYMSTRCPAWCDRILLSPAARKLIDEGRENGKAQGAPIPKDIYGIIGETVCMGDHKPVYLNIRIKTSQGILNYCSCDTHAPKRVEHFSNNSTINVNNNNSCSSNLASKLVCSNSSSNSCELNNAYNSNNNNNSIRIPTTANETKPASGFNTSTLITSTICTPVCATDPSSPTADTTTTTQNDRNNRPSLQSNNKHHCSHCFGRIQTTFDEILSKLEMSAGACPTETNKPIDQSTRTADEPLTVSKAPLSVRISVFDTDSNANVCMCSLYSSSFSLGGENRRSRSGSVNCRDQLPSPDTNPQICPNCRNIIKHQPVEHRKTLISRRLMLANDIIVNRIDNHYLNTYTNSTGKTTAGGTITHFEPYTPESVESHSPVPEGANRLELDESQTVDLLDQSAPLLEEPASSNQSPAIWLSDSKQPPTKSSTGAANSAKKILATEGEGFSSSSTTTSRCGVSPRQLKSRLEKLKRISDRRKQFQQGRSSNNSSGGTQTAATGTASADELLTLNVSGKSSRGDGADDAAGKEDLALVSPPETSGGDGDKRGTERNDRKLVNCFQRHCCAVS
ncbi:uncharacterized protein LOC131685464 [Topomyia yanbarensis]|uniref:uncharacterized protein LOC131685464 n=1 Tax=Topomyia yanbarensis TaxID=2498891 RepID=UPI00273C5818|nr:uncharacterized protein LOC131685464 [Topomyia yanbarensis]XP_058825187.1 uncharacterized protein LOC131685464 [Topomyia yanbarensis]